MKQSSLNLIDNSLFDNSFRIEFKFRNSIYNGTQIICGKDSDDAIEILRDWYRNEDKQIIVTSCQKVFNS